MTSSWLNTLGPDAYIGSHTFRDDLFRFIKEISFFLRH